MERAYEALMYFLFIGGAAMSMLLLPVLERKERAGNWTIISDESDSLIGEYIEF